MRIENYEVPIEYEIEDARAGVARLELPEKLARGLEADDLPKLDRPLRFAVSRGARGAISADSLDELPWKPEKSC